MKAEVSKTITAYLLILLVFGVVKGTFDYHAFFYVTTVLWIPILIKSEKIKNKYKVLHCIFFMISASVGFSLLNYDSESFLKFLLIYIVVVFASAVIAIKKIN